MGRIPEEELERLKREVSVKRLAEAHGVELKRHGADWIGLCPFHDDKEPSFVVSPGKNLWNCLGACQAGGSSIDFVMKAEGVGFRHAVELMRANGRPGPAGPAVEKAGPPPKRSTVPKLESPLGIDVDDDELARQVIEYYHQTLKDCPEALAYLESRGINDPEAIDRFRLGFANRAYLAPPPDKPKGRHKFPKKCVSMSLTPSAVVQTSASLLPPAGHGPHVAVLDGL